MKKIDKMLMFLLFLVLALATEASAVLIFTGEQIEFRIIDAVRYKANDIISIDLEIIGRGNPEAAGIFKIGRRFSIELRAGEQTGYLKIGGHFSADFQAFFDDMGSGKVKVTMKPQSLQIIPGDSELREIPDAFWEQYLPFLPLIKVAFILSGWLLAIVLSWRSSN